MNDNTLKALQVYMSEETRKFGIPLEFEKLIKEEPIKAFKELSLLKIVTPGFIKYFENYNYEPVIFNDWDKLYTIEDEKFKDLNNDCKCTEMMQEIYRIGMDDNFGRFIILKNIGIEISCQFKKELLEMIYKIKGFKVDYEMKHDKFIEPYDIGNIHLIKEGDKYRIVNGNHRLLGFMYYCLNVNKDYKPIKVWMGTKNGSC